MKIDGKEYDIYQAAEIKKGIDNGIDVSLFLDNKFNHNQMEEIRCAIEDGIDPSSFAKPELSFLEMQIYRGLADGSMDISYFLNNDNFKDIDTMIEGNFGGIAA